MNRTTAQPIGEPTQSKRVELWNLIDNVIDQYGSMTSRSQRNTKRYDSRDVEGLSEAELDFAIAHIRNNPPLSRHKPISCACGRTTFQATAHATVQTANGLEATSCWLSLPDEFGPRDGCKPDERTWDILSRRRRGFTTRPDSKSRETESQPATPIVTHQRSPQTLTLEKPADAIQIPSPPTASPELSLWDALSA